MLEALDLAGLDGEQLGLAARLLDCLPRLDQLDLLDPVGGEEGDPLALKLVRHDPPSFRFSTGTRGGAAQTPLRSQKLLFPAVFYAREPDAVVEPARAALPELEALGREHVAAPPVGERHAVA